MGSDSGGGGDNKKEGTNNNDEKTKTKKDDSNIFLDNLGKIFLGVIGAVIATLVRSSYNTVNRNKVRDFLQETAALDPIEIEELRIANSHLTPDVFRTIMMDLTRYRAGPASDGNISADDYNNYDSTNTNLNVPVCTYNEFVFNVRRTMARLKGPAFTVQLGHLIDRAVVDMMEDRKVSPDTPMPVSLWLVALSLALDSPVKDRIRILYEILQMENPNQQQEHHQQRNVEDGTEAAVGDSSKNGQSSSSPTTSSTKVIFAQIPPLVGYLQATCQLPPDTQIIPTETKYPTQQWVRGQPRDLVPWDGSDRDVIDLRAFASILRSKSVCAWGECYQKRKFNRPDDV
jgi:hypothetical protein